jgi:DNA repair exonuclease SbcCD ATPase subunit/DNA repair exonuclease SbcCD nuclease subunit
LKIAHVSDLHIRNFKYRSEYRAAFSDLYGKLALIRPDLIINTGDTVHSKLAVSPELFDDVAEHMLAMTRIAPYWVILGNHDLNLKNPNRTDAISPIVRALQGRTQHELRMPEGSVAERMLNGRFPQFAFHNHDIRRPGQRVIPYAHDINIGLYHGSVSGCVTDQGFVMEDGEAEVDHFKWMDFVMLGDIHKRQAFRGGRIQYPGSLIQQNYGEELVKGFLLWDIRGKQDFDVAFHQIEAPGRFYTIQVPSSLDLNGISVPVGSRIKALVEGGISPSRRIKLEESLTAAFRPLEIITPDVTDDSQPTKPIDVDELVGSREQLMRDHLRDAGIAPKEIEEIVRLFKQYEAAVDSDEGGRGTTWQLQRMSWDNMMNYGEGSSIDFTRLQGLVGIFAPNASGKSSIFDILLEGLFDKVSKDVPRNIDLVNDNKDIGSMVIDFESQGQPYTIERTIERIHYGQRKFTETKQWGETSLDFSSVDESLNGTTRPETERAIRSIIGNFEDFVLTAMVSQNPIFGIPGGADILNCKETDRRKILFRFLDLDVYERVGNAAKDDLRELMGRLKGINREALEAELEDITRKRIDDEDVIESHRERQRSLSSDLERVSRSLERVNARSVSVLESERSAIDARRGKALKRFQAETRALEALELSLRRQRASRLELSQSEPDTAPIPLVELSERLAEIRSSRDVSITELSRAEQLHKQGKRSLTTLEDIPCGSQYPTCRFISEATSFLQQRAAMEAAISRLRSQVSSCATELTRLEDYDLVHKRHSEWQRKVSEMDVAIAQAEVSLGTHRVAAAAAETELTGCGLRIAELDTMLQAASLAEIEGLRDEHRRISTEIESLGGAVDKGLRGLGGADHRISQIRTDLRSLEGLSERISCYERLLEVCGKNGLPYRILSLVLPVINAEIAKILSGIVKFNVFFEADHEKQTVSLFIRYGDYRSRPLSLGSGAEKFIASLAVRVALLSVSSLPKTDVLIIDEGFGRLDPEHLEALQRMFEYLREAFGSVFIVSHVDSMRDIVDHNIEITSRDGYAHVEVS